MDPGACTGCDHHQPDLHRRDGNSRTVAHLGRTGLSSRTPGGVVRKAWVGSLECSSAHFPRRAAYREPDITLSRTGILATDRQVLYAGQTVDQRYYPDRDTSRKTAAHEPASL